MLSKSSSVRDFDPKQLGLGGLRNLGPKSVAWLQDIGITSRQGLASLGAIEVCRRLRKAGHPATLNMAYGIEAALMDCDWRELPIEFRKRLALEYAKIRKES